MIPNNNCNRNNRNVFYLSWIVPLILIIVLVIYSVKELFGYSDDGNDFRYREISARQCEKNAQTCPETYYCCDRGNGTPQCCPFRRFSDEGSRSMPPWHSHLGLWNMWYFWLAVILILASCFTGFSYWRRKRQLEILQRLTAASASDAHNSDSNRASARIGGTPFTMYDVPPDALLRFLRETSGYGCQPPAPQPVDPNPPSYNEVTSKPEMYPCPAEQSATNGVAPSPAAAATVRPLCRQESPEQQISQQPPPSYASTQLIRPPGDVENNLVSSAATATTTTNAVTTANQNANPTNGSNSTSGQATAAANKSGSPTTIPDLGRESP